MRLSAQAPMELPIHYAARVGSMRLIVQWRRENPTKRVESEVNKEDADKRIAIHCAAAEGHLEVGVQRLTTASCVIGVWMVWWFSSGL